MNVPRTSPNLKVLEEAESRCTRAVLITVTLIVFVTTGWWLLPSGSNWAKSGGTVNVMLETGEYVTTRSPSLAERSAVKQKVKLTEKEVEPQAGAQQQREMDTTLEPAATTSPSALTQQPNNEPDAQVAEGNKPLGVTVVQIPRISPSTCDLEKLSRRPADEHDLSYYRAVDCEANAARKKLCKEMKKIPDTRTVRCGKGEMLFRDENSDPSQSEEITKEGKNVRQVSFSMERPPSDALISKWKNFAHDDVFQEVPSFNALWVDIGIGSTCLHCLDEAIQQFRLFHPASEKKVKAYAILDKSALLRYQNVTAKHGVKIALAEDLYSNSDLWPIILKRMGMDAKEFAKLLNGDEAKKGSEYSYMLFTKARFVFVHDLMKQHQLSNVFLMENDVFIYQRLEYLLLPALTCEIRIAATPVQLGGVPNHVWAAGTAFIQDVSSIRHMMLFWSDAGLEEYSDMQLLALYYMVFGAARLAMFPVWNHQPGTNCMYDAQQRLFGVNTIVDTARIGQALSWLLLMKYDPKSANQRKRSHHNQFNQGANWLQRARSFRQSMSLGLVREVYPEIKEELVMWQRDRHERWIPKLWLGNATLTGLHIHAKNVEHFRSKDRTDRGTWMMLHPEMFYGKCNTGTCQLGNL